jgi:hypothetical protein
MNLTNNPISGCTRRSFLSSALSIAATPLLLSTGTSAFGRDLNLAPDTSNGGTDPFPILWLDKNGSHNQSPMPGAEPSNIYHFKGRVARCNGFTGMGTDNKGQRIAFGSPSTDFSFMQGEYFAGRTPHPAEFSHI